MTGELDETELRRADGHASDLALGALVDGQDEWIPAALSEHVDACPSCTDRLAELATLAFSLDEALLELGHESSRVPAPSRSAAVPPRPFPAVPFGLGLLLAALSSLPRWLGDGRESTQLFGLDHASWSMWRSARLVLPLIEHDRAVVVALCLTTTLLAGLGGWLLARNVELPKEPWA